MNKYIDKYLTFNENDKTMWMGIAAVGGVIIILLSVFTSTSFFYYLERFLITLFEMFLPGYLITKMFFDNLQLSDNVVIDKFMISFAISIATVETLYYMTTYLRPYVFNTDEEGMEALSTKGLDESTIIAILLVFLVVGVGVGIKHYQNKKQGIV